MLYPTKTHHNLFLPVVAFLVVILLIATTTRTTPTAATLLPIVVESTTNHLVTRGGDDLSTPNNDRIDDLKIIEIHEPHTATTVLDEIIAQNKVIADKDKSQGVKEADLGPLLPLQTPIDLARYMGTWYEIFRSPNPYQKHCVSDVVDTYTYSKTFQTIYTNPRCIRRDNTLSDRTGELFLQNAPLNTAAKVSFLPTHFLRQFATFAQSDYYVLHVEEERGDTGHGMPYKCALVGGPSRKYVWLLCREPKIDEVLLDRMYSLAVSFGFDLTDVIYTKHTSHDLVKV